MPPMLRKIKLPGDRVFSYSARTILDDEMGRWLVIPSGSRWTAPHDDGVVAEDVIVLLPRSGHWVAWWVPRQDGHELRVDLCRRPAADDHGWSFVDREIDLIDDGGGVEVRDCDELADAVANGWIDRSEAAAVEADARGLARSIAEDSPAWVVRGAGLVALTRSASLPERAAAMPLPLSTTWAVLAGVGAHVRIETDCVVVDGAHLPGHRWARSIGVLHPGRVDEADNWLEAARSALPGVAHPAVGLPRAPDASAWRRRPCPPVDDIDVEWFPHRWVALDAAGASPRHRLRHGDDVTLVDSSRLWDAVTDLPSAGGDEYRRVWTAAKRLRQQRGQAAFFAGVHEGRIVAAGGIVLCEIGGRRVGRFEDIHTQPGHRRRGFAGHIIAAAQAWASDHGADTSVLVADADGEAMSLYEHLGLTRSEEAWMVLPRRRID